MKQLETNRVILREWKPSDADDLYEYASGPNIGPVAGWKPHENLDESKKILVMFINAADTWAIELKENHKVIGSVGLHHRKKADIDFDLELGYVLSESYWGKGIMPEVVERVKEFAFEELKIQTLLVSHFTFNSQSKRVIEKAGFKYLKQIKDYMERFDGVKLDEEIYLMDRSDYEAFNLL